MLPALHTRLALLLLSLLGGVLLTALPSALAAEFQVRLDAEVHRVLDDPSGWKLHTPAGGDGIAVYEKEVPSLGLSAFKGVKILDPAVDPEHLFRLVGDIDGHMRYSSVLEESKVVFRDGDDIAYYQVMKPPPLIPGAPRFWISQSRSFRNVGGEKGHHVRAWSAAGPTALPELRAELLGRYPKAVEVTITHGSWEIDPQDDGTILFIYKTVSAPGGSIPDSVARMLATRTLPDNMLTFEKAAR